MIQIESEFLFINIKIAFVLDTLDALSASDLRQREREQQEKIQREGEQQEN